MAIPNVAPIPLHHKNCYQLCLGEDIWESNVEIWGEVDSIFMMMMMENEPSNVGQNTWWWSRSQQKICAIQDKKQILTVVHTNAPPDKCKIYNTTCNPPHLLPVVYLTKTSKFNTQNILMSFLIEMFTNDHFFQIWPLSLETVVLNIEAIPIVCTEVWILCLD